MPVPYDLASAQVKEIAPTSLISSFTAAEDGSFLILNQDIAKKTEYETLGAGEARIDLLPSKSGAAARTLIQSTKGLTLIWSRDLHSYAYSKDGAIYFASIDDKEPRLIAGKKKDDKDKEKEKEKEKKDEEDGSGTSAGPSKKRALGE